MKKYKTIVIDPPWQYEVWGKNSGNGCRGDFSGRKVDGKGGEWFRYNAKAIEATRMKTNTVPAQIQRRRLGLFLIGFASLSSSKTSLSMSSRSILSRC